MSLNPRNGDWTRPKTRPHSTESNQDINLATPLDMWTETYKWNTHTRRHSRPATLDWSCGSYVSTCVTMNVFLFGPSPASIGHFFTQKKQQQRYPLYSNGAADLLDRRNWIQVAWTWFSFVGHTFTKFLLLKWFRFNAILLLSNVWISYQKFYGERRKGIPADVYIEGMKRKSNETIKNSKMHLFCWCTAAVLPIRSWISASSRSVTWRTRLVLWSDFIKMKSSFQHDLRWPLDFAFIRSCKLPHSREKQMSRAVICLSVE